MPSKRRDRSPTGDLPVNNTVKLTEALRDRVVRAMMVEGFTVWSEFCRVALTEKCHAVERRLREHDVDEYARIYGTMRPAPVRDGNNRDGAGRDGAVRSGVH